MLARPLIRGVCACVFACSQALAMDLDPDLEIYNSSEEDEENNNNNNSTSNNNNTNYTSPTLSHGASMVSDAGDGPATPGVSSAGNDAAGTGASPGGGLLGGREGSVGPGVSEEGADRGVSVGTPSSVGEVSVHLGTAYMGALFWLTIDALRLRCISCTLVRHVRMFPSPPCSHHVSDDVCCVGCLCTVYGVMCIAGPHSQHNAQQTALAQQGGEQVARASPAPTATAHVSARYVYERVDVFT